MLPARSELITSDEAEQLMKDPAELRRRVSELKEENVILAKRLQEALRDSARLSATYRERQWQFLSQREPQLCASLAPTADLGAHLLLHTQATGRSLAAQVKEVTERAQRMEEETASNRVELEMATEEADAFDEDVKRYSVQAARHYRRLRDASAALAALRRHKHLLCERLRAADWALDLLLHDEPTRLLAADMMDAGPEGAVRLRHMQERLEKLESQLRPIEVSVASVSGSRRAVAVGERELRVLDYEERDKDKDKDRNTDKDKGRERRQPQPQQSPPSTSSDGSSRGAGGSSERAADARGQRRRPRSREARDRAARADRLAQDLAEQRERARRAARGLAVLREEAEDLRAAVDKMRKAVRKIRSYDAQLVEEAQQGVKLVARAAEQQEARLRQLRRYSRARQHVSASFESALRSSQRRRTTLQSALRHSQLHLRVLHHIMQHLLPIDGEELPAQFYRGLVDASEKERDVLMDRMAALAQKLCRAKSRAQADWQRLHLVRSRIQALEAKLRPYVATVGGDTHRRKPMSEWSAIRERQLEKELQELRDMGQKYHEAALKVESRYLQEMWALHHLFQLAVSRLEARFGRPESSCASLLSEADSVQKEMAKRESQAAAEEGAGVRSQQQQEVAGKPGEELAGKASKEVAGKLGEEVAGKASKEVAGKPGEEVAGKASKEVAGKPGEEVAGKPGKEVSGKVAEEVTGKAATAEEVTARRRKGERKEDRVVRARQRIPRHKRQKRQGSKEGELTALRAAQDAETCHVMLPACICPHPCSQEPDAPCTILRRLAVAGRRQRTSLTNFK